MPEQTKKPSKKKYYDNISVGKRTKQTVHLTEQRDKPAMFEQFLKNTEAKQTVVITKSKRNADTLSAYLKTKEIQALAIHGNHRTEQVEDAAKAFNASELNILITTDMILQALELTNIEQIVNYDLPSQLEDYFTRLRFVDEVGEAISFVSPQEEGLLDGIEFKMRLEIPQEEIKDFVPTLLAADDEAQPKKDKKKKPRHRKLKQKAQNKSNQEPGE